MVEFDWLRRNRGPGRPYGAAQRLLAGSMTGVSGLAPRAGRHSLIS